MERDKVYDPSFDNRPTSELLNEFEWMRQRVLQIRLALLGAGRRLVPLREYLELCKAVGSRKSLSVARDGREPEARPNRRLQPTAAGAIMSRRGSIA